MHAMLHDVCAPSCPPDPLSAATEQLLANGYCIIPDLVPASLVRHLDEDLQTDFDEFLSAKAASTAHAPNASGGS